MKSSLITSIVISAFLLSFFRLDNHRFEGQIQKFEEMDSLKMSEPGGFLFVGSSSIRMWTSLGEKFADYPVINRGFGGSTFADLIYFYRRIIRKYAPSKVFIYEGDNDTSNGQTPEEILTNFQTVTKMIREDFPECEVHFIAIKPSPARWNLRPIVEETNALIRSFCRKEGCQFIDIYSPMLDESGVPRADIFVEDRLHMNIAGYEIWSEIIRPYIEDQQQ